MFIFHALFKRAFIFAQLLIIALVLISTVTAQTSSLDLSFNAVVSKSTDSNGSSPQANFAIQPDEKYILVKSNVLSRLNIDGTAEISSLVTACSYL